MRGMGPIFRNREATAAAAKRIQLIQSGKLSLTTETAGLKPAQSTLNIRINAAAPIRPTTAGRSQPRTPSKTLLPLNWV